MRPAQPAGTGQKTAPKSFEIAGAPVLDGRLLTGDTPALRDCTSPEEYCALADRIRGPWGIIIHNAGVHDAGVHDAGVHDDGVHNASETIAITDYAASFPVFYTTDSAATRRIAFSLKALRQSCPGTIAEEALFFHAINKGIGWDPLYADVQTVRPGTVARFSGRVIKEKTWLDWTPWLEEKPITPTDAEEQLVGIAGEYLQGLAHGGDRLGCLLSGGTDSAFAAYVLHRYCPGSVCLTADYTIRRYSEGNEAERNARAIGIGHRRIVVSAADHRRAFRSMNSAVSDVPAGHSQLTSLYRIGEHAQENGIRFLVSGENAGGLFFEYGSYFDPYPTTEDYTRHVATLQTDDKMKWVTRRRTVSPEAAEELAALGCSPEAAQRHADRMYEADVAVLRPWAERLPLPALLMLRTQLWTGVPFQNGWLPAQKAFGNVSFVSPFSDLGLIRFIMTLPMRFKYNNGVTKALLREILLSRAGIDCGKVSSPNPARVWTAVSGFADACRGDSRLRALLLRRSARNVLTAGRSWENVLRTSALSLWLRAHEMGDVAKRG